MENFVVSARKYRPNTFKTVVGQDSIITTLKNAIKNDHLAQSFLFCGPRGVGKTTCARILAKTINCENLTDDIEACDECESCISYKESSLFNIFELDAASNNSVDDIRTLVDQVRIPPQIGKYKVYIIDEVHMLSTQAFNAFLKTLEEPPAYVKFILATTERHKIIPTILSRCQIYNFRSISVDDIANHLAFVAKSENIKADSDALHIIAQKSDGALRDALSIFDQIVNFTGNEVTYDAVIKNLNVLDYDYYFKLTDNILKADISSSLLLVNEILEMGFDGHHFLIGFGEHLRNLLICKDAATIKLLEVGENIKKRYFEQSKIFTINLLLKILEINNKNDVLYKSSSNKRLQLEIALMQMCSLNLIDIEQKTQPTKTIEKPAIQIKKTPVPQKKIEEPEQKYEPKKEIIENESKSIFSVKDKLVSVSEDETKENVQEIEETYEIAEKQINKEELIKAIKKYACDIEVDNPAISKTLINYEPELKENNVVVITLDNKVQDDRQQLHKLLGFLKNEINNTQIRLETKITEKTKISKAYTPKEKFSKMAQKNPALNELKKQLDLEIEF